MLAVSVVATLFAAGSASALAQEAEDDEEVVDEITVTGTQIKGAKISGALAVSVVDAVEIEAMGISSGDELLDSLPEVGQNFFNEAEGHSGGVNSVRGDVGAYNLRNMGTGNTLVLLNAFVPVNSANSNAMPVYGIQRVEVLRDGASAIYGADAVAGVINTVLKKDLEGLSIRARFDDYENYSRNDYRLNMEWGKFFNEGRTNVGVFADYYHRDRLNAQDDPKWADENYSRYVPDDWVSAFGTNYSSNSAFPQVDFSSPTRPATSVVSTKSLRMCARPRIRRATTFTTRIRSGTYLPTSTVTMCFFMSTTKCKMASRRLPSCPGTRRNPTSTQMPPT
jgi:outer membrane receptor protein involved in Fe transport